MPGSGKGTQGAVLGQLPSFVHISMGDVFRKIPRNGRFGREIEQYTSQGLMVPDDLTVRIFERHLNILEMQELVMPEQHTLVLDGLPRSYCAGRAARRLHRRHPDLPPQDRRHGHGDRAAQGPGLAREPARRHERRGDPPRLQTYYDETFKTLSFYPTELIFDVDAGRRMIDVLCDIANRLAPRSSAPWRRSLLSPGGDGSRILPDGAPKWACDTTAGVRE